MFTVKKALASLCCHPSLIFTRSTCGQDNWADASSCCSVTEREPLCSDLNDEEDILGGVGDGEDGRARQCGDGRRLDVRTQHRLGLLRVEVEEKVLRYLRGRPKQREVGKAKSSHCIMCTVAVLLKEKCHPLVPDIEIKVAETSNSTK